MLVLVPDGFFHTGKEKDWVTSDAKDLGAVAFDGGSVTLTREV